MNRKQSYFKNPDCLLKAQLKYHLLFGAMMSPSVCLPGRGWEGGPPSTHLSLPLEVFPSRSAASLACFPQYPRLNRTPLGNPHPGFRRSQGWSSPCSPGNEIWELFTCVEFISLIPPAAFQGRCDYYPEFKKLS